MLLLWTVSSAELKGLVCLTPQDLVPGGCSVNGASSSQNGQVRGSSPPEAGASRLPLLHTMAGLGAPDTSHLSTAVIPSVTVVSTGSWVKAGATSRQRTQTVRREYSGQPGGGICLGVYRTNRRQCCSDKR